MPSSPSPVRRSRWPRVALACTLVAAAAAAAAWWWFPFAPRANRPVLGRVNLLLVTIDTLRADRVGAGLTPAIEALARRGTSFAHARSVAPLTLPAHTSLMTGLVPPITACA